MTKHRQLLEGARLPQDFLDAQQEFMGSYVSPNFAVNILNPTTLRIPAGTDNAQVSIGINGRWRYVTLNVDAAAPGGLPTADCPLFVAASDNVFASNPTPPPTELDSTDYTFRLIVKPVGQTPSGSGPEALWRQVGVVTWSGSAFTLVKLAVGFPVGLITTQMLQDGTVTDAKVAANAAIQPTKLAIPNDRRQALVGDGTWVVPVLAGINPQTVSYVLVLADSNGLVEINMAGANTVTVPADGTTNFPVGSQVTVAQMGAGQTQIVAGVGVTLRAYGNNLRIAGQYGVVSCIKRAANDWWVAGNLVP